VHTTGLRSQDFAIAVDDETATLDDVFTGFDGHDRVGIVIHHRFGAAGAGSLILAAVTAFYDDLRATAAPFFAYADYFAFHVGADHGTLAMLDVYPAHKEVVVPNEAEPILEAINDRGVTRLLVPDGPAAAERPQPAFERPAPAFERETLFSAQRRIRTALVYSPTGRTPGADVVVRGSAQSDAYIRAMLGNPQGQAREPQPAQTFRRMDPDQALRLLLTPRG
jgi:hypothetical protein